MSANAASIVRRPLSPLDVGETKRAMQTYQEGLQALLAPDDWQRFLDRKGEEHRFLKRSGWRKIALWFELNLENRSIEIDRDPNGTPLRARVIARAVAPNGRFADGEGGCDRTERSVTKPEHDLLATASTRAFNRAVSNLVGLGAVSAEELGVETEQPGGYGPAASDELVAKAAAALAELWPESAGDVPGFLGVLTKTFETQALPEVAARTILGLKWWIATPVVESEGGTEA